MITLVLAPDADASVAEAVVVAVVPEAVRMPVRKAAFGDAFSP